jgi:hypothetical protein
MPDSRSSFVNFLFIFLSLAMALLASSVDAILLCDFPFLKSVRSYRVTMALGGRPLLLGDRLLLLDRDLLFIYILLSASCYGCLFT